METVALSSAPHIAMRPYQITLPWPENATGRPDRSYRALAWSVLTRARRPEGAVLLKLKLHPPAGRKCDVNAAASAVLDAIVSSGWLYRDHRDGVRGVEAVDYGPSSEPRVEVEVQELVRLEP